MPNNIRRFGLLAAQIAGVYCWLALSETPLIGPVLGGILAGINCLGAIFIITNWRNS